MFIPFADMMVSLHSAQHQSPMLSHVWELWLPPVREAQPVLQRFFEATDFPLLFEVGAAIREGLPAARGQTFSFAVDRTSLLEELSRLWEQLQTRRDLPPRYLFAPHLSVASPLPTYTRKTLRTGRMIAATDVCLINRNWDGIDRVEDLTTRVFFEDADGFVRVLPLTLATYLERDLLRWRRDLCLFHREHEVSLVFQPQKQHRDILLHRVLARAERWRMQHEVPDYQPAQLARAEALLQEAKTLKRKDAQMGISIAAYACEVFRAQLGGHYEAWEPEADEECLAPKEWALSLVLPSGTRLRPFEKVLGALQKGTGLSLQLQSEVLLAHRRQTDLLEAIGAACATPRLTRREAAVRILCDVADLRVDRMLLAHLHREQDPALLGRLLDRLVQAPRVPDLSILRRLGQHHDDDVARRALRLLHRHDSEGIVAFLSSWVFEHPRPSLRPVIQEILEMRTDRESRRLLREIGAVRSTHTTEKVERLDRLPLLAEILEDCANPGKLEAAFALLEAYPDREEEEMFGAGLADPQPPFRLRTIGLLSGSDRKIPRKLLHTRVMFEQDPICRQALQEALSASGQAKT